MISDIENIDPNNYIKEETKYLTCQGCCFNWDRTSIGCPVAHVVQLDCVENNKNYIFKEKQHD